MSSVITNILSSTVGLLWNKARDFAAKKLKDGDTTDEKFREIIIRDLNAIKTTLNCLSRRDLLSSYSFLKEGALLLNLALHEFDNNPTAASSQIHEKQSETSPPPKEIECAILNEALILAHATRRLRILADRQFNSAKEVFKTARERATEAFWNESLNTKERIMACKLRVVARILECLENPDSAIASCLLFLEELHGLSAVRETFSVYLNGGLKSMLNKAERLENVKSVMLTNFMIFEFATNYGRKHTDIQSWPTIELADRMFNPTRGWYEVCKQTLSDEVIPPLNHVTTEEMAEPYFTVVNSRSEIITRSSGAIKVISKTAKTKVVNFPDPKDGELMYEVLLALAVDREDNVYAIRWLQLRPSTRSGNVSTKRYVMYVLDDKYNVKYEHMLDFLEATHRIKVSLSIGKNNIIMIANLDYNVYVCDKNGNLEHQFERDQRLLHSVGISDTNEIMVRSDDRESVCIYTKEGSLKLKIKIPERHTIKGIVFHYVISKIIVLTCINVKSSLFLLCYSKKGELESSTFLCYKNSDTFPNIVSHPSGPVALVRKRSVAFI